MGLRWILHIDMDSFFVSVERLLDPSLNGKPVIVGGDPSGRGVVSSASYEARGYGVHSGMPCSQAARLCPVAIFINGHGHKYGEYSEKIKEIFERYSPLVEMTSVDEAYIDLSGTERLIGHPLKTAERIYKDIKKELLLPSSGGLGTSKLIAKISSDLAKPKGLLWVMPGYEQKFLSELNLKKMPGIGEKSADKFFRLGLKKIGDLCKFGRENLEQFFGKTGADLYLRSMGLDDSPVRPARDAKSVGREHTYTTDTSCPDILKSTLCYLSEKVAGALREIKTKARTITLKLRYSDFQTITRASTLLSPTDDSAEILHSVLLLLNKSYSRRVRIRLLGVSASNFALCSQYDLFLINEIKRAERLNRAVDKIREAYGFKSIVKGESSVFITKN